MELDTLTLARSQMAMSLAFHIVFASAGIAMPVLMPAATSGVVSMVSLSLKPGSAPGCAAA